MRTRTERTCPYCATRYSRREHYERHVRTHTGERHFACGQCEASFARRDTWRRHMRTCHSGTEPVSPSTMDPDTTIDPMRAPDAASIAASSTADRLTDHVPSGAIQTDHVVDVDLSLQDLPDSAWHWDDSLALDPDFSLEDLGTYDLFNACPGNPWLPLRPAEEQYPAHMSHAPIEKPQRWFNVPFVSLQSSPGPLTSRPTVLQGRGDEISRDALAGSLQKRLPDITLPSTAFLNRCIRAFTTQLWHIIPIVHLPTFRPAQTNPLLLLSICSLGALAEGSSGALYHAERLFAAINKAILISSQPNEVESIEQTLPILQAAAIGQTYALLSGKTADLMLSQLYHGSLGFSVIAVEKFMLHSHATELSMSPGLDPEQDWAKWVQVQTVIRLRNAIQVHNGEISAILHAPSAFRVDPVNSQTTAPDALFLAKTPAKWASAVSRNASVHLPVPFSLCAVIEGFIAEVGHARAVSFAGISTQLTQALLAMLCTWFDSSIQLLTADSASKLSVLMLCHSCFIHMLCDMDLFERACGRDGAQAASTEDKHALRDWASTADARRAASHAICIQLLLERFRLSDIPAIHVARSSWHAGLLLAVYSSYAPVTANAELRRTGDTFPEFHSMQKAKYYTEHEWTSATCDITPERCSAASFTMTATLRRLGPWHNAATYADTLGHVIDLLEQE